jgi:hypothetical protein
MIMRGQRMRETRKLENERMRRKEEKGVINVLIVHM